MAAAILGWAAPATSISTKVPSRGLARRTLSEAIAIGCQYPLHTFGDVSRRQRCAGDIPDVAVDLERAAAGLADELREPARAPDLAAIGLPVLQDLDAVNGAVRRQRHRVVDIEMLADHPVEDEKAGNASAGLGLPDPAGLHLGEMRRRRKSLFLRFLDREILHRIGRLCDRHDRRRRQGIFDPAHGSVRSSRSFIVPSSAFKPCIRPLHQKKNPTPPRNESESAPTTLLSITL